MSLTGKQRRHLRALGHPLDPIVTVGKEGPTEAVVEALDIALTDHELVKVRVGGTATVDRKEAAKQLGEKAQAEVAQIVGNIILLYRAHPDDPTIKLPKAAASSEAGEAGD